MNSQATTTSQSPNEMITERIAGLTGWQGSLLKRLRQVILASETGIGEDWKWSSPIWVKSGMICSAAVFKDHLKLHFFKGAALPDPGNLFNAGLDAKTMRAIDFTESTPVDEAGLQALVREAIQYNHSGKG